MAAIGTIRDRFGWFLVVIMVISLIAFLLMGIGGNGNSNQFQVNNDLSVVNGETVSNLDFERDLETNIINYQNQTRKQDLTDDDMSYLRNATYNQLVTDKILNKVYDENGIVVSDAEFLDMLSGNHVYPAIKSSFVDSSGAFSTDRLRNFLSSLDVENTPQDEPGTKRKSWETFERAILKERIDKKFNSLVAKSITVPTFMAKDNLSSTKSTTTFNYVTVPYSSIVDSTLNITDVNITNFIAKNAKKYQQEASADIKFTRFDIVPSQNDIQEVSNTITTKTNEWKVLNSKKDSAFVTLHSDVPFDNAYYGKNELANSFKDSLFMVANGTVLGPIKQGNSFVSYKLIDKKMIADSLQVRHLLISFENVKSQAEADIKRSLFDSLYNLVDSLGIKVSSLTAQFSEDASNANLGGNLKWVKPNQMVKPFNDKIFFDMKEGDVSKVATNFGLHIVEVYKANLTKQAVQVATLTKNIEASTNTQELIYSNASRFAGLNNTSEKFEAAEGTTSIIPVNAISKEAFTIQNINGNARSIVKWAFEATEGNISTPFPIGDSYFVVLLKNKNEKGLTKVNDNNRIFLTNAVAKEMKAELIKAKLNGTDLNTIATNNNVQVASAQNISFLNPNIGGSSEPMVAGASLGISANTVSKPIVGTNGVYVINVTTKNIAEDDAALIETTKTQMSSNIVNTVSSKVKEALKNAADIIDNRFNFF